MQDHHVPSIGLTYWVTLLIASVLSVNLSDIVVVNFGLGIGGRILLFAAVLLLILIAEREDRSGSYAWYWAALIAIHAAANKVADFSTYDLGLGRIEVIASLAVLLVVGIVTIRSSASLVVETLLMARGGQARPMSDAAYWIAMIFASTLGAVAADFCTLSLRIGLLPSMAIFGLPLGVTWLAWRFHANRLFVYWVTVVAVRGLGTVAADFLVKEALAPAGLATSTILTATLMAGSLLLWGSRGDGDSRR